MQKLWAAIAVFTASLFLLSGCATLPEGAQKPGLSLGEVTIGNEGGHAVFNLPVTLSHDSLSPLPLRGMQVTVFINGAPAASYEETLQNVVLNPRESYSYNLKVKANLLPELSSSSLARSLMVKAEASVMVRAIFETAEDNLSFNPTATYEGIIGHVQ